jgi:hypothetical protein
LTDIGRTKLSPAQRLSAHFREQRSAPLRQRIEALSHELGGRVRIVDLGGSAGYWRAVGYDWMRRHGVEVTCINPSVSELNRGGSGDDPVTLAVGDACNMHDHADNSWDMVHTNSVIEHVGRWADMKNFAREVRRLAPVCYVQTPYFWCPIDPHFYRIPFIHWLPVSWKLKLLARISPGHFKATKDLDKLMNAVESSALLDRAQFTKLFPDARIHFEMMGPIPKSLLATR